MQFVLDFIAPGCNVDMCTQNHSTLSQGGAALAGRGPGDQPASLELHPPAQCAVEGPTEA